MTAEIGRRGLMLVLSSPSGAGKTTIARLLIEGDDDLTLSVSATTRLKRPDEIDGRDYHFIDEATFARRVAEDAFLEHATVFGNRYGTLRAPVEADLADGHDVLFDIDWQGAEQLARAAPRDLVRVFILPPSMPELEVRLHARAQDSDEVVAARMAKAADEMNHWSDYDYVVVNRAIKESVTRVQNILAAERLRRDRQTGLAAFVRDLRGG
ncbi:MAG: guanylate kinase [Alphaproteobacteria bacterium]